MGTAQSHPVAGVQRLWRRIVAALAALGALTATSVLASKPKEGGALSKPAFELWEVSEMRRYAPGRQESEPNREPAGIAVEGAFDVGFPDDSVKSSSTGILRNPAQWPPNRR